MTLNVLGVSVVDQCDFVWIFLCLIVKCTLL